MYQTREVLHKMFTTPTGVAMCDSGGVPIYDADGHYVGSSEGCGRRYERVAGWSVDDFDAQGTATLRASDGYLTVAVSTWHWLLERLTFDAAMNERLRAFSRRPDRRDTAHWADAQDFPAYLEGLGYFVQDTQEVNTYNYDSLLDETLQFVYFVRDNIPTVVLQIHRGCDVRGGYSQPYVFRCYEEYGVFDFESCAVVACPHVRHSWRAEGSHLYFENDLPPGLASRLGLKDFPIVSGEPPARTDRIDNALKALAVLCRLPDVPRDAVQARLEKVIAGASIIAAPDGQLYCPLCGGPLVAMLL